eukprot:9474992-Pyramimonas_sp.AAC.1
MARGRHANAATGAFGGAPLWGHDPREGCAEMARGRHANPAAGASGEAPMGPRSSCGVCRNFPKAPCELCYWRLRWNSPRATILVRGVQKWPEAAMRTLSLGPS